METVVKIADFEEPILALVDHGLEINLMSMTLYQKGKWPIDLDHGWRIRVANTQPSFLYGACANVKVTIGDVSDEQNFFVQDHSSYSLILGQPYIVALRMESKVLDDGSAYARVQSKDGKKAVQFMTICVNHARNKEGLRDHPLPKIQKDFKENRKFGELHKWEKQYVSHFQIEMQGCTVLDPNDVISRIFEEVSHIDTIAEKRIKLFKRRAGQILYEDLGRQQDREETDFNMEQDFTDTNDDEDANVSNWHSPKEVQIWRG
ncbi:hypothetical protein L7F22_028067 [Adiantum nelumboides]|nr:hypothetical protein [Adiantum nelumboides]